MMRAAHPGAGVRFAAAIVLAAALAAPGPAAAPPADFAARYVVRVTRTDPPRFEVTAILPAAGRTLAMEPTRPGDVPEILRRGWPALVSDLQVSDGAADPLAAEPAADSAWALSREPRGPLTVRYRVDTQLLADLGWPAPREAAYAEADRIVLVGRALFVTTEATKSADVSFELPSGWRALGPWPKASAGSNRFHVPDRGRLVDNLVAFTRAEPRVVRAAGFELTIVPMGDWAAVGDDVAAVLKRHARRFVSELPSGGIVRYLVVLLPMRDRGAESFYESQAVTYPEVPSRRNRAGWANRLGHELFHYWNGWRLRGADYASTQWFQEGFTEYAANRSTAAAGYLDAAGYRELLATQVGAYRRLTTPLEAPGTRKGPPLYSGGALTALAIDLEIRAASGGERDLGDFLRALWRRTGGGEREYDRSDIVAALDATAPFGWAGFLDAHVTGTEPLPLDTVFARLGLRLEPKAPGEYALSEDPAASTTHAKAWRDLLRGR